MKNGKIRCDVQSGGGTYHETFDRAPGWQDEIRRWVASIGVKKGSTLSMYSAPNGITYRFVRDIEI